MIYSGPPPEEQKCRCEAKGLSWSCQCEAAICDHTSEFHYCEFRGIMTDLHDSFERAKQQEFEQDIEPHKCLLCYRHISDCKCTPGAGWAERDCSGV